MRSHLAQSFQEEELEALNNRANAFQTRENDNNGVIRSSDLDFHVNTNDADFHTRPHSQGIILPHDTHGGDPRQETGTYGTGFEHDTSKKVDLMERTLFDVETTINSDRSNRANRHGQVEQQMMQALPSPQASETKEFSRNDSSEGPVESNVERAVESVFENWRRLECSSQGTNLSNYPNQRSLHTLVCHRNSLYLFGGYNGAHRTNDLFGYNFTDRQWRAIQGGGDVPSPRDRHVAVVHDDRMLVFGGFCSNNRVNDLHSFDFLSQAWTRIPVKTHAPSPRHSHSAVVYRDSLFVFGGYDGAYRNDLTEFNLLTEEWLPVEQKGAVPRRRYRTSLVVHQDKMWLFGGHDGTRHLNGVHCFDFASRVWETIATEGPVPIPRDSHVACAYNDRMYVFGGSSGSAMSDFHCLELKSRMWTVVNATGRLPSPRFCHAGVQHQKSFYVLGGYDGRQRLADFYAFDFRPSTMSCLVPPSTLLGDLERLVNNPRCSDVVFLVEDQCIFAHRVICMRCPYFEALLTGSMAESSAVRIPIPDVQAGIFVTLLRYLYTDRVTISLDNAMDMFVAADRFGIERLQSLCENQMLRTISVESAPGMLLAADAHSATSLREKCIRYIVQNFDLVSTTPHFEEMARENVELVIEILHSR